MRRWVCTKPDVSYHLSYSEVSEKFLGFLQKTPKIKTRIMPLNLKTLFITSFATFTDDTDYSELSFGVVVLLADIFFLYP